MPILTYRDLEVWKQGIELVEECYKLTARQPYRHHVSIAIGSHGELETYFELSVRLGFLSRTESTRIMKRCDSVGRLLSGLHRALKRRIEGAKAIRPSLEIHRHIEPDKPRRHE